MLTPRRDFVNRVGEIDKLNELLNSHGQERDSVVLLHGRRGIGKTQLLAMYLRRSNYAGLRIAYVDLPRKKDYFGLIDDIVEDLGREGFNSLEQTYDELLAQFHDQQVQQALAASAATKTADKRAGTPGGIVFEGPVSAESQLFVSGNVTLRDAKIKQIFNLQLTEPRQVKEAVEGRMTAAFSDCLRAIARDQLLIILLDHWEEAKKPVRNWLDDNLLDWAAQLKLGKALIVLAREELPVELENRMGIYPLAVSVFSREVALEFWEKNGFAADAFDSLRVELFSIPGLLAMEIDGRRLGQGAE
jgi:hypothetical protein